MSEFPTCPKCGHVHREAWEWDFDSSEIFKTECEHCDAPLIVIRNVSVDYQTKLEK